MEKSDGGVGRAVWAHTMLTAAPDKTRNTLAHPHMTQICSCPPVNFVTDQGDFKMTARTNANTHNKQ